MSPWPVLLLAFMYPIHCAYTVSLRSVHMVHAYGFIPAFNLDAVSNYQSGQKEGLEH